jgi:hypothetical protein
MALPTRLAPWLAFVAVTLLASRAGADLGANGTPIVNSLYRIDLTTGPVLATSRQTALGGAYVALSEGAEGLAYNPAAAAIRSPLSMNDDDYDLTAGVTFPASIRNTDFDNNGRKGFVYDKFIFGTAAGLIQHHKWGVGVTVDAQQYALGSVVRNGQSRDGSLRLFRIGAVFAHSFFDEQLVVGAGVRVVSMNIVNDVFETPFLSMAGAGMQAGAVFMPASRSFRLGVSGRSAVSSDRSESDSVTAEGRTFHIPQAVEQPWEVEFGFAFQLGARPLNIGWRHIKTVPKWLIAAERRIVKKQHESDSDVASRILRARYRAQPRQKVLVSAALLVTGSVTNAVGVEAFLAQTVERSGERTTVTPRLGIEAELIPHWLQVRAGSYVEPSRFLTSGPRLHGTFGLDAKVLQWDVFGIFSEGTAFRAGGFIDGARDYLAWGISAGLWR